MARTGLIKELPRHFVVVDKRLKIFANASWRKVLKLPLTAENARRLRAKKLLDGEQKARKWRFCRKTLS